MLPRPQRLALKTELRRLRKEGKIFHSPFFGLLMDKNNLQTSRFGFIISKKIHKQAVRRNRVRRLLREAVKGLLPQVKPGFDAVFLAKKNILGQELAVLQKEVRAIFQQAGLL